MMRWTPVAELIGDSRTFAKHPRALPLDVGTGALAVRGTRLLRQSGRTCCEPMPFRSESIQAAAQYRRHTMTDYRSHGAPFEHYELTRQDHRRQKDCEAARKWATEQLAKWHAEEQANPSLRGQTDAARTRALEMMAAWGPTPDHDLMRWQVRLYCGHITETIRHRENAEPTMHGSCSERCPACGLNPAFIVAYEPIGLKADVAPPTPMPAPRAARPSRKQLEARIAELEAELAAQHRSVSGPRQR